MRNHRHFLMQCDVEIQTWCLASFECDNEAGIPIRPPIGICQSDVFNESLLLCHFCTKIGAAFIEPLTFLITTTFAALTLNLSEYFCSLQFVAKRS